MTKRKNDKDDGDDKYLGELTQVRECPRLDGGDGVVREPQHHQAQRVREQVRGHRGDQVGGEVHLQIQRQSRSEIQVQTKTNTKINTKCGMGFLHKATPIGLRILTFQTR